MAKKEKTNKIKLEKVRSEEQLEMIRFVKILIIVIVFIVGIYLFTRIFVTKDLLNKEDETKEVIKGTVNYNMTLIGAMLQKPEKEYYVMIYDTQNLRSVYYSGLMTNYEKNEDALKIYFANLNSEFNNKFYDKENVNLDVKDISDLKVGDLTLIKVKDGKIAKTYTEEEEIAEELAYIEPEEDTEN